MGWRLLSPKKKKKWKRERRKKKGVLSYYVVLRGQFINAACPYMSLEEREEKI